MTVHRSRRLAVVALMAVALPVGLVACGDDSSDTAASSSTTTTTTENGTAGAGRTSPTVTDVWARPATAGGTTAIYMTITGGKEAGRLVKVELPAGTAGSVELHESMMSGSSGSSTSTDMGSSGGMMSMSPVDSIDVPAGGTVQLKPGGYHVMVMDLDKELTVGDRLPVTLTFEPGGTVTATATVREP